MKRIAEDWGQLYFGKIERSEIQEYIVNPEWQQIRLDIKGQSLNYKYSRIWNWLEKNNYSRESQVQATNYVTALSRGGLIKPEDYRVGLRESKGLYCETLGGLRSDRTAIRQLVANKETEQRYFLRSVTLLSNEVYFSLTPLPNKQYRGSVLEDVKVKKDDFIKNYAVL